MIIPFRDACSNAWGCGWGDMFDFGEWGKICLNQERQGACVNCLWWEWDAALRECRNSHGHVCPGYRERLFSLEAPDAAGSPGLAAGPKGRGPQVAG
ncbi:MAG: hypothetical protein WA433_01530 [Desulfobaccales bacterium]